MKNIFVALPLLLLSFVPVTAQPSITIKEPSITPKPQTICRHNGKFYRQGTIIEIKGKKYICTLNHGLVLVPSLKK